MFFQAIISKLKNKSFWAGALTAIGSVLAGTLSAPEAIINIIQTLIGG